MRKSASVSWRRRGEARGSRRANRGHALRAAGIGLLILVGGALAGPTASAGPTPISSPGTISQPGSYRVTNDLTTADPAITITASNVDLDLGNRTLTGAVWVNGASGVTIRNGTIQNAVAGVVLSNSSSVTVSRLTISRVQSDGIVLSGGGYNTILGNTCNYAGHDGVFLEGSSHNAVLNNTLSNNNLNGIILQVGSNSNAVQGNTCKGNARGIRIRFSSSGNTVIGNTVVGNAEYDLDDDDLYSGNNGWRDNSFATDNEPGIYAGPQYGFIR